MSLQKDYEVPSTGATASYHVVQQVTLDKVMTQTIAAVASYLSADAKAAGKLALYSQQVALKGLPAAGQDAFEFAESELVAQAPDGPPSGAVNRYAFAGAQIVT
jgi:hypothetical protein